MAKLAEAQISLTIANEQATQIEALQEQIQQKVDSNELESYVSWSAQGLTVKDANSTAAVNISADGVRIYANDAAKAQAFVSAQTMNIARAETEMLIIGGYILQYMSDGTIVLKEV